MTRFSGNAILTAIPAFSASTAVLLLPVAAATHCGTPHGLSGDAAARALNTGNAIYMPIRGRLRQEAAPGMSAT